MYYQHNSFDDIKRKLRTCEVITGFMIQGSNKICVVYGNNQRGGKMNVTSTHRANKGRGHKVLSLAYVICKLDPECKATKYQGIGVYNFVENFGVKNDCLLLPFINLGVFEGNMVVVYDDWDVCGITFNKCLLLYVQNYFNTMCLDESRRN